MSLITPPASQDHARNYWREPIILPAVKPETDFLDTDGEFLNIATYMPTLCWLARGDGYIIWYNQRWHDYCGTSPDQMEGWGWQAVHDPKQLPTVMQVWRDAIERGEPFEMVLPLRGADGRYRPFLTRIVPGRNKTGEVVRWFGVNTEIGDQVRAEDALRLSEAKFEVLTDAMPQMVWSALPDGQHDYYNAQWYAFTGVPVGSTDGEGWNEMFHPDDRDRAWSRWRHCLSTGEPYEIEYRLRHHTGSYRWTLGRAQPVRGLDDEIVRWIGTCTDIHEAKREAEENELLGRELSHRIKNIFAVIGGLINLTAKRSVVLRPVMGELLDRIAALGRAHDFARPNSPVSQPKNAAGTLHGLVSALLQPYSGRQAGRLQISGDDVPVDDRGATPLSLAIHELATNSAKYGALSTDGGRVTVATTLQQGKVCLVWAEHGGPEITGIPENAGFGTELANLAVNRQLGGTIKREWSRQGLIVSIDVTASHLSRGLD